MLVDSLKSEVYSDTQNVHNHNIQKTFRQSVNNLISIEPTVSFDNIIIDLNENNFNSIKLLIDFSSDENIHTELNLTFKELLIAVYQRIINNQHKKEIIKILDEEIQSSKDKCFTGRITRLVSCLCGFENDIKLEIADNEQIGNIISLIQNKYGNDVFDVLKMT